MKLSPLSDQRIKLLDFVIESHGQQKRKYNLGPYWYHVLRVAQMAEMYGVSLGFERGLLHDIIEDVPGMKFSILKAKLQSLRYTEEEINLILRSVDNLTSFYNREGHDIANRATRKRKEAERLWTVPPDDQTIKYCDMIDNLPSIKELDPAFAEVYIKEKRYLLSGMNKGHKQLFNVCKQLTDARYRQTAH